MDVLFLKILNMSISASFLILAIIFLRLLLKKAPKWMNCVLWALVAVRLLYPISLESSMSLIPNPKPLPLEILTSEPSKTHTSTFIDPTVNPNLPDISSVPLNTTIDRMQTKSVYATLIWMSGVAVMFAYAAISYLKVLYKVKASLHLDDRIWICDDIQTPFILGCFKPKIYIPSGTDESLLPHIIAHENAHLKRFDHWWKPFGYLVLTIHWFNPFVWIAYILLCRDIELACDEKVIRKLKQSESIDYSKALLTCSMNRRTVMVCPLAFGEIGVKERVKHVLNYKKPTFWIIILSVISCISIAVCFLTNPKRNSFTLRIVVPAGSQEAFVYSHEEISTINNSIEIWLADGLIDTEIVLSPVNETVETDYTAEYLTPGKPVIFDAEKDTWFKVGIKMQNPSDKDLIVYVKVENVEVRISDETYAVREWFNYMDHPSAMEDELTMQLPEYPNVSFHWNQESVQAFNDSENIELYTGMPIWNVFFCDLTGDGKPELCSTISLGSGIIDNHILIYDYANGASYQLEDRGKFDYSLRLENDKLYVDKKIYNSDELVETGYLSFVKGFIEIIKDDGTISNESSDETAMMESDTAISHAIYDHYASEKPDGLIHVESHVLLANETKSATPLIGNDNHMEETTFYLLVYHEKYASNGGKLESVGGSYIPAAITFSFNESDGYRLKEYWEPSDGNSYVKDIRAKFPMDCAEAALNDQAYIEELKTQNYNKAQDYLNSFGSLDPRIVELLDTILSSPVTSSTPSDYITANREAYDTLVNYGPYTLQYCFAEFLKGEQTDLRGNIMAYLCCDILISMKDEYISANEKIYAAQDWFDKFKEDTIKLEKEISEEELKKYHSASWLLLQMINE